MAYQRPKPGAAYNNMTNADSSSSQLLEKTDKEDALPPKSQNKYGHHPKPLVLFSVDISHWSPSLQSVVLIGGLILFMCLYGYYQELVVYGWFDRKLSVFCTFLHFLGCSFFAQLQRNYSYKQPNTGNCYCMSMGTASPRVAFGYYFLLVLTKTAAQGMSNLCMTQINYPAKVLFKSANPVVTMIIGVLWFHKTYPSRDYLVVVLLVLGLYVFITGDLDTAPHSTGRGIFYVVLSMFGSAGVPMIQEHCIAKYNATVEDLIYFSYVGSTAVSFILSIVTGEFNTGLMFLVNSGNVHTWFIFIAFCTFGFLGANFSTSITAQYGALVNGISNTFRKAVTIGLSFFLFPERNELTTHKIVGTVIFFSGLLVRIFTSHQSHHLHAPKHVDGEDVEAGQSLLPHVVSEDTMAGDEDSASSSALSIRAMDSTEYLVDLEGVSSKVSSPERSPSTGR